MQATALFQFSPCIRKIPWRRESQPTPVFLLRAWGGKESDTAEGLSLSKCSLPLFTSFLPRKEKGSSLELGLGEGRCRILEQLCSALINHPPVSCMEGVTFLLPGPCPKSGQLLLSLCFQVLSPYHESWLSGITSSWVLGALSEVWVPLICSCLSRGEGEDQGYIAYHVACLLSVLWVWWTWTTSTSTCSRLTEWPSFISALAHQSPIMTKQRQCYYFLITSFFFPLQAFIENLETPRSI